MYLTAEAETRLYAGIHDLSAPGSQLFLERPDPDLLKRSQEGDAIRQVGVDMSHLLQSDARPSPGRWLTDRGWPVTGNAPEQVMKMAGHMVFLSARRAG